MPSTYIGTEHARTARVSYSEREQVSASEIGDTNAPKNSAKEKTTRVSKKGSETADRDHSDKKNKRKSGPEKTKPEVKMRRRKKSPPVPMGWN